LSKEKEKFSLRHFTKKRLDGWSDLKPVVQRERKIFTQAFLLKFLKRLDGWSDLKIAVQRERKIFTQAFY
jgi:hypothetical protein